MLLFVCHCLFNKPRRRRLDDKLEKYAWLRQGFSALSRRGQRSSPPISASRVNNGVRIRRE